MSVLLNDNLLFSTKPEQPSTMVRTGAFIMPNDLMSEAVVNAMTMAAHVNGKTINDIVKVKDFSTLEDKILDEIVFTEWKRNGRQTMLYEDLVRIFFWWHPYEITDRFEKKLFHFVKQIENEEDKEKAFKKISENHGNLIVFV